MKPLIIANWKCNPKTRKDAEELFNKVKNGVKNTQKAEIVIAPPFVWLPILRGMTLAAQDCAWEECGPYTGEVSPQMLEGFGVKYVIIGHSERRIHFKETDEMINKKLKAILKAGLRPVLCIGEKKGENAKTIVSGQIETDLKDIAEKDLEKVIIAYEPIWAISTNEGEICSPEQAKAMLNFIRTKFNHRIIYGGSVDSKIVNGYLKVGFEGVLVGGASLRPDEFIKLIKNV